MDIIRFVRLRNISKSLLGRNSCYHTIVFDLLYMKLLHNNYVIFIRLSAGYGAILVFMVVKLIQCEVIY